MSQAKLLQPSFGGGEYAPDLLGRVDLARYGISGTRVRNFIVRTTGGLTVRDGTDFVGEVKVSEVATRLLPFIVSEDLAYVIELSPGAARFIFDGAYLESGGSVVEIATPWQESELFEVHYTQSADTMVLTHTRHAPRALKRTAADAFTLSTLTSREGPFRSLNGNEAHLMAASATTGTVTITTNVDVFASTDIGALVYLEPKALGNIKPWTQDDRGIALGDLRRSDGKVYKATTVPSAGAAPNYATTGNVRPTHEIGREWDGPATSKVFDTITYVTGIEWEYLHSGYGIVEITGYTDARTVTAVVRKTLPPEVVGGLGTPDRSWTFSGDGATVTFAITGAVSSSTSNYTVEISGAPIQSDPNYTAPTSGGTSGGGGGFNDGTDPSYQEP